MRRTSWLLLGLAALIHLGLLVGWRWQLPLVPYFFDATVLSGGRGLDFYAIYQAGYNARHGVDIYEGDPAHAAVVVPYFTPYRYLPIVAYTLGAALSLLPPLTAYKLWVVILELTLLACLALTYWHARGQPNLFARLAAMWLVFTPFYLELFMGQFSLVQGALIFAMLVLAIRAAPADDSDTIGEPEPTAAVAETQARRAGARPAFALLWLASVLWKINTLLFVPVLVRLRLWRPLALGVVLVTTTTVPYFSVFPAHWRDFIRNNFGSPVTGHELGNLGLRQFVYEVLAVANAAPAVQAAAQMSTVALVLALALGLTFYTRPLHLPRLLCLWTTAFFMVSPQVWEHHYVMLLPVLVVVYWLQPHWLVVLIWLLLALPTPFGFIGLQPVIAANHDLRAFPLQPAWQPLVQHASKALPTVLLFAHVAAQLLPASAHAGLSAAVTASPALRAPNTPE